MLSLNKRAATMQEEPLPSTDPNDEEIEGLDEDEDEDELDETEFDEANREATEVELDEDEMDEAEEESLPLDPNTRVE